MEGIDFENTGSDFGAVFKVVNLAVAAISVITGVTELFSGFAYFLQGLYILGLGGVVGYLEFKNPPQLYAYASSFFSFLGRGLIYVLIAILNFHGSVFRVLAAVIVLLAGIVYIVLEFIPSIQAPENMQGERGLSTDELEDVI
ncbi:putative membrane protein [Ogataea parapolymorpha DL-1]|uniref:Membrane protein n=1 Tax=Ogataea parapolymorpha (strain ATCC 26012 / BCRC 20466 / JCM 22074 / NRRL Y-7560 / DL-1) TaxID=871575 RepID=W1Q765_OGAPD|nr:putative membrane protein [Ogataea parapolymorpha DL-1]ESW96183.1 putative membrane protein [Ogataea parapolymorpha DL-1]